MNRRSLSLALLCAVGCAAPTAPSPTRIASDRASWSSRHLTSYAYDLEFDGFFLSYSGKAMHLLVDNDTVRSATYVATGDTVPGNPSDLPTVDDLFRQALAASSAGTLSGYAVDPTYRYPRFIEIRSLPDASGSMLASGMTPIGR